MKIIWCMVPEIWSTTDRIFLSFWTIFCPFTPLTTQKIKITKNEKNPGDIMILHRCTKYHDHMLYCSWDVTLDRCNYFSFRAIFCPFTPANSPKNQNFLKMKKNPGVIIISHKCNKIMITYYTVPERWLVTGVIIFHFELFFALLPSNSAKNQNQKKPWDMLLFYTCEPKIMIRWCTVPEKWCTTDRQTDKRMDRKSDI